MTEEASSDEYCSGSGVSHIDFAKDGDAGIDYPAPVGGNRKRAPIALFAVSRRCCTLPDFGPALIRLSAHLLSAGTRLPAAADPE